MKQALWLIALLPACTVGGDEGGSGDGRSPFTGTIGGAPASGVIIGTHGVGVGATLSIEPGASLPAPVTSLAMTLQFTDGIEERTYALADIPGAVIQLGADGQAFSAGHGGEGDVGSITLDVTSVEDDGGEVDLTGTLDATLLLDGTDSTMVQTVSWTL